MQYSNRKLLYHFKSFTTQGGSGVNTKSNIKATTVRSSLIISQQITNSQGKSTLNKECSCPRFTEFSVNVRNTQYLHHGLCHRHQQFLKQNLESFAFAKPPSFSSPFLHRWRKVYRPISRTEKKENILNRVLQEFSGSSLNRLTERNEIYDFNKAVVINKPSSFYTTDTVSCLQGQKLLSDCVMDESKNRNEISPVPTNRRVGTISFEDSKEKSIKMAEKSGFNLERPQGNLGKDSLSPCLLLSSCSDTALITPAICQKFNNPMRFIRKNVEQSARNINTNYLEFETEFPRDYDDNIEMLSREAEHLEISFGRPLAQITQKLKFPLPLF
ncbi:unnamed protein product [Ceratitis capitata]|uniref:(Mediterranean fruit fly) hypothetical protein n=1 Tax=Ceratitis capitata TaxID=7213 RepID=A0A811URH7_CERCA|nr:unnamed protein product [Ceratitis capitata]